jgi:hypothetical protein
MRTGIDPFSFLVNCIAGWMNQHQHDIINYLIEENRVLRKQIGDRRLRFTDDQRRRLAVKARQLRADGREAGISISKTGENLCDANESRYRV